MASLPLSAAAGIAGSKYYLDTSAVFALAFDEAAKAGQPSPPKEIHRATSLRMVAAKATAVGAQFRTSILAIEEIAAKVRNEARRKATPPSYNGNWYQFRTNDQRAADAVDVTAKAKTISFLQWTDRGLTALGVKLECFAVPASDTLKIAQKARVYHQRLLGHYKSIDAMDALHIVFGAELGIKSFVSFDDGWKHVVEIDVYG